MNPRTSAILLALALALGAYVWFAEIRGEQRRAASESARKRLVELDRDSWRSLELPTSEGPRARLVRGQGDAWRLESPVSYPSDATTVNSALDALEALSFEREIEPMPEDLSPFGLDADDDSVVLTAAEGELRLRLGGQTPVGTGRYLLVSSRPERIYIVKHTSTTALEPRLLDLRDRRIAEIQPDQVREISVRAEADGLAVRAVRAEEGWRLVEPMESAADERLIDRLIEDLELARATGFIDEPAELSGYGLDPPQLRIELRLEDASVELELASAEDTAYVRRVGAPALFEVPARIVGGVPRKPFDYRYKRVVTLDEGRVRELELRFPRDDIAYAFAREDYQWVPREEGLSVESLQISDLLYAIEALDATALEEGEPDLARLGLEPPRVRVTARDEAGEVLGWLELGDPDPERGLAARSSASEVIWRVENDLGEDVPLSIDAFRTGFATQDENASVETAPDESLD